MAAKSQQSTASTPSSQQFLRSSRSSKLTQNTVDLGALSATQLNQVKKQLDDELEHLTSSFGQLRAAQAKFRECLRSIAAGVTGVEEGMFGFVL